MTSSRTAATALLMSCHACGLLTRIVPTERNCVTVCARCNAPLHSRKPDSIGRTWAYIVAAAVLYVPANVYPIMTVKMLGRGDPQTILSGVEHLFAGGQWGVALLVFFASIVVPVLKLLGLSFLALSVQLHWQWRPKDRTALYRLIEFVGRWSMLDIFMISILVALVQLDAVATIEPGLGATAFAAVVVLTMLAAMAFDPRLIWDSAKE